MSISRDELAQAQEQEQRYNDLLYLRSKDEYFEVQRQIVDNPMFEINKRFTEYLQMFKVFSREFLALQTIQDFKQFFVPLQAKKLDANKPIAVLKSNNKKVFYFPDSDIKFELEKE